MHFIRLRGVKPVIDYALLHIFLGWSVLHGYGLAGAVSLIGIYVTIWSILKLRLSTVFCVGVISNLLFMETVTLWFSSITPSGWLQKIGPLSTKVWLLVVVGIANLLASLAVGMLLLLVRELYRRKIIVLGSLSGVAAFAVFVMSKGIISSFVFAIGVHGNGTPLRPFWGVFSTAPFIINPLTCNVSSVFGFWGSSFFFSFTAVVLYLLCKALLTRRSYQGYLAATFFVCLVIVGSNVMTSGRLVNGGALRVIAVSRPNHQEDYVDALSATITKGSKLPTVVVLPEYDNLITPDTLVPAILANYGRWQKLESSGMEHTYFAGTQDAFYKDTRYTQNYLVNEHREYLQRSSKQFLVPGGEYVIGWVDKIFQKIDPEAAGAFSKSRGRYAINNDYLSTDLVGDDIRKDIAIGACSSTLYPSGFQKAVKNGADIIAINISYQQFQQTKQYERFANQYMDFMAYAYQRPVISSADYGSATIHLPHQETIYRKEGPLLIAEIPKHRYLPIYARLGDALIVGAILMGTTLAVGWHYKRVRK